MKANEIANRNSISSSIKLRLIVSAFANLLLLLPHYSLAASTSIKGDGTLGTLVNGSQTVPCPANCSITGGTIRGTLQFQSLDVLTLGAGDTATFGGPSSITNILTRVTGLQSGLQQSLIDGTLQTTIPGANLFLINPAGIVFGPTASLNVSGSVNFTTANYIRLFDEATKQSAMFYANPASDAVITAGKVSILSSAPLPEFGFVPAAFGFLDGNGAPITVRGSTLSVPVGQSITMAGGAITVASDVETGQPAMLAVPAGEVRLASVASPGEILLPTLQTGPNINGQSFSQMGTISLTEGTFVDVSDHAFEAGGAGGTIRIRGGQLVMDSAALFSSTQGNVNGAPTAVDINISGDAAPDGFALSLNNFSAIASQTSGKGRGGDIVIVAGTDTKPGNIDLAGSSTIVTSASGDGRAGDISVTTHGAGTLSIHGTDGLGNLSNIESFSDGSTRVIRSGNSGNISIVAGSISVGSIDLHEPGYIRTATQADGNAGKVDLHADDVYLGAGGFIETRSAAQGATGLLMVTATNTVSLTGDPLLNIAQQSALRNSQSGTGTGNGISVSAKNVQITDGAQIVNRSNTSSGTVDISASDSILVSGKSQIENQAFSGEIGDIQLSATKAITLSDQAVLRGSTTGSGTGGTISLTGESISLSGQSVITSRTISTGQSGQIRLTTSDSVSLSNGSIITTSSLDPATGAGGPIDITAGNTISLIDPGTKVLSEASGSGNGGNITFVSGQATTVNNNAAISASSTGTGNAGTITVQAGSDFQSSGGIVRTTAAHGLGGDILITAGQDIRLNSDASVSASSTGPGNAGNITAIAGDDVVMQNSSITTQATQAAGGNIKIGAQDQIVLQNSLISASVMGGGGSGGNISIDPTAVILQNSQILAQAVLGSGGNITIITPVFLADQTSVVSASSQFGLNGTVTIQNPTSNLSGTVSSLPSSMRQMQSLQTGRCAALADSRSSSLIVAGRDSLPAEPGGWSPSPFALIMEQTDPLALAGEESRPLALSSPPVAAIIASADTPVSLRHLTPAGFLTQRFAENGLTGCRA